MENPGHQLEKLIIHLKTNQSAFAKRVGVTQSFLSSIINEKKEISRSLVEKILFQFPDLNLNWLFTGKGAMFMPADLPVSGIIQEDPGYYSKRGYKIHQIGDEDFLIGILVKNLKTAAERWDFYNQELFTILSPGINRQTVSKYMLGVTLPSLPALIRFELITGIPLAILCTREIDASELPDKPIEPGNLLPVVLTDVKRAHDRLLEMVGK